MDADLELGRLRIDVACVLLACLHKSSCVDWERFCPCVVLEAGEDGEQIAKGLVKPEERGILLSWRDWWS